ncbi:MAG: M48 family metallopeptidase [Pseudomonadota bacterium]|nr:M48 family metallopeptidase [Pseudomonadota bacterium]
MRASLAAVILICAALSVPAAGQTDALRDSLLTLRTLDARVAAVGHRLAVSNRDLCSARQWLPGFAVHDLSAYNGAYRAAAVRAFGFGADPRVLAVVPGAPAERAGLRVDDELLGLDGRIVPQPSATAGARPVDRTEQILEAIETAFADGAAAVEARRVGATIRLDVGAEEGCATRFQLLPARGLDARADGRYVQITTSLASYVSSDEELAAVLAHEFAHNVLGHKARLDAAGVARGFLGNFGRNARLIRETEMEADRLSVYLLDRAGYDPEAPVRFWSRFRRHGLNFLGSATHGSPGRRIALFRAEIEIIRRARAAGQVPTPPFALPAASAAR